MLKNEFTLRNVFVIAISLAAMTMFNSCGDDDDDGGGGNVSSNIREINATDVLFGSSDITTVKAVTAMPEGYVLATGTYSNNGFKLTLPETVPEQYLISPAFAGISGEIFLSDPNARLCPIEFPAYDSNDNKIGEFGLGNSNLSYASGYMYVDRNTAITGSFHTNEQINNAPLDVSITYNYSLKKGWNIVYTEQLIDIGEDGIEMKMIVTTEKPAGENFMWWYSGGNYEDNGMRSANTSAGQAKTGTIWNRAIVNYKR